MSLTMPDMDNDGDSELLFTGKDDGHLHLYLNTSDDLNPVFTLENNQLNALYLGDQNNRMAMDDLDFDGNGFLDLIIGHGDEHIARYETIDLPGIHPYHLVDSYFTGVRVDSDYAS
jgi:hypothetical protein